MAGSKNIEEETWLLKVIEASDHTHSSNTKLLYTMEMEAATIKPDSEISTFEPWNSPPNKEGCSFLRINDMLNTLSGIKYFRIEWILAGRG